MADETVTVELTSDELGTLSFALLKLEHKAWQDLWAAQGMEELRGEDSNYADNMGRWLTIPSDQARQAVYLRNIMDLRQKIRAVPRPATEPAPKRRAKAGADDAR